MKVLYFHQYFATPNNIGGTRSYEQARALISRGHQVTMICGHSQGGAAGLSGSIVGGLRQGQVDGIDVIEFDLPYSNSLTLLQRSRIFIGFAWRSILLALRLEFDICIASSTPLTAALPGIAAAVFRRKPFVFEVRDLWPELPRAMGVIRNPLVLGLLSALEWVSYRTAIACVGLSPGIVRGIIRRKGDKEAIAMIPNGCDITFFSVPPIRPTGVSEGEFVAVFTGAHGLANGLDSVLDAAKVLKERARDDIRLLFYGSGKLKKSLQIRVTREGLTNCEFHEPVPKPRIASILSGADVGLQILANVPAFYYGTSPNKFFDYLASGLPILTNYPGWIADLVNAHGCGVAVPPDDPEAFANALINLAEDRDKLLEMGRNARLLAKTKFSRDELASSFVDVLEVALANSTSRGGRASIAPLSPFFQADLTEDVQLSEQERLMHVR